MAIGRLTYLDLHPEKRREAANHARQRLHRLLDNPFLTESQQKHLHDELLRVAQWEHGMLPVSPAPDDLPAERGEGEPEHHAVEVSEDVDVDDSF